MIVHECGTRRQIRQFRQTTERANRLVVPLFVAHRS
jgi:hypothetical protein